MNNERIYEFITRELQNDGHSFFSRQKLQSISNDFAKSHCTNPTLVQGVDYYTGESRSDYYPCGKCDHCRNSKSNDLLSRIYLDLPHQGYLYFVTLTYTSVYPTLNGDYVGYKDTGSRDKPCWKRYNLTDRTLDILKKNILHLDNLNSHHRYCYSTCLLDMDDFSGFMKRLRKSTPEVRYQFCVFGEYGHKYGRPHMHALISSNKSIDLQTFRNAWSIYGCSIGNCYVDDLTSSGSVSGTTKYVTKYVSKKEDFNDSRVKFAYYLTYPIATGFDFPYLLLDDKMPVMDGTIREDQNLQLYEKDYSNYSDFKREALKRPRYSVRNCFGSLYYASNLTRFLQGNEELPTSTTFSVVFPQYFRRKVRRQKYPLGLVKTSWNGNKYYVNSTVPLILGALKEYYKDSMANYRMPFNIYFNSSDFQKSVTKTHSLVLYKHDTKEYLLPQIGLFVGYRYDKKQRIYIQTDNTYTLTFLYKQFINQVIAQYNDDIMINVNKSYSNKIYYLFLSYLSDVWMNSVENEQSLWNYLRSESKSKVLQNKYNTL